MAPLELTYTSHDQTTSSEHPFTFVMMVDEDAYSRHQKDKSIPLAEVVDDFSVFRYEKPGKSGRLTKPSQEELQETFGTTNVDVLCQFMLINGVPHGNMAIRNVERAGFVS